MEYMDKGSVNITDIKLVMRGQEINMEDPLFRAGDHKDIYCGDTVEFYKQGDIFPTSGTVSNYKVLQIDTFDMVRRQWQYYLIKNS